ncbi:MAG: ArsO family NAD(P)H-dependent flavin-containing monooxygenase [Candidatus Cyclobacteriaceae bacterium M2_1C_046]
MKKKYDVIIIGGGQSGLAVAYYLRRTGLSYCILDKETTSGGSWQHYWDSLRLFSPAKWSSLPGIMMSGGENYYPTKKETVAYLQSYEHKYNFPIIRPVEVKSISKNDSTFTLETSKGFFESKVVVSATGSFNKHFIPAIDGINSFKGKILHSSEYRSPERFKSKTVAIIGEGNSGAQILSEVATVSKTLWITSKEPQFLPDHVDGRYLFDVATQSYEAKKAGENFTPPSLGDIVMVPPVKKAREDGYLNNYLPIAKIKANSIVLTNEEEHTADILLFCTGFNPGLDHLKGLNIIHNHRINTEGTKAKETEGLWLVGYGSWTGFASATLIGVGRTARQTVQEVAAYLKEIL